MAYKEWEKAYAFLSEAQLKDPYWAIYACASGDNLFKDRQTLFEILYAAIASPAFEAYEAEDMIEFIYCWERMITMIEACHRLKELDNNKQFHHSYSGNVTPD